MPSMGNGYVGKAVGPWHVFPRLVAACSSAVLSYLLQYDGLSSAGGLEPESASAATTGGVGAGAPFSVTDLTRSRRRIGWGSVVYLVMARTGGEY